MSRTVYLPYRPMRERLLREVNKTIPKKKRKQSRDELVKELMQVAMTPHSVQTFSMEANVMLEEESYFENGCQMFFPESQAMLEMLWRAKMNLELEDLDLSKIPMTFSIAWPRCEIDGSKLHGCMVSIMTAEQHRELLNRFARKYLDGELLLREASAYADSALRFFVTHFDERTVHHGQPLYRCCIPGPFVSKVLKDEGQFNDFMDGHHLAAGSRYVVDLEPHEQHQQYVMSKLIVGLLVYMQACPEHVHDGFPDGRKEREFTGPHNHVTGKTLGAPSGLGGTHASPSTHWRSWHFRSYPKRRDGSKRKGVVKVKGTIVNAEINPHTVEDEALRARIEARPACVVVGH